MIRHWLTTLSNTIWPNAITVLIAPMLRSFVQRIHARQTRKRSHQMSYIVHEMDLRVMDAMCRLDFASFVRRSFHTLSPGTKFKMNWHIYAIAYALEQVRLGKIKRLIIN